MPENVDLVFQMRKKYPETLIEAVCFLDFFLRVGYKVSEMKIGFDPVVVFKLIIEGRVHEEPIGKPERSGDEMYDLWKDLSKLWLDYSMVSFKRKAEIYRGSIASTREAQTLTRLSALQMDEPLTKRWRKRIKRADGVLALPLH